MSDEQKKLTVRLLVLTAQISKTCKEFAKQMDTLHNEVEHMTYAEVQTQARYLDSVLSISAKYISSLKKKL